MQNLLLHSLQRIGKAPRVFHGENRAGARGHLAITQSCHKAIDVIRVDHHLVSSASLELIGNKGYERLTEVFGPLWLIPLEAHRHRLAPSS